MGNGDSAGLYWPIGREEVDPIWRDCAQLSFSFCGSKENAEYPVLAAAIDTCLKQGELRCTATRIQNYAELMSAETVSFRERYGFDQVAFIARQIAVGAQLAPGGRAPSGLRAAQAG